MRKKIVNTILSMFIMLIGTFLITSCCSPRRYTVDVSFVSTDMELVDDIKSYTKVVDYGEEVEVNFVVPEGFETSEISAKLRSGVREGEMPVEIKYKDDYISKYNYATEKSITIKIEKVIADCTLYIDMSTVTRKICTLDVSSNRTEFNRFTAVAIDPSELSQLTVLDDSKVVSKYGQSDSGKIDVAYGDYIALIYDRGYTGKELKTVYSRENYFTESSHKANIGKVGYSYYNRSNRGNLVYSYGSLYNTRIFYLGMVRESMQFYDSIPDYVESKGFKDVEEIPNTLSFMTNMSKYSSDLMTTSIYKKTTKLYSAGDSELDKIEGTNVVLEKANPVEQRYNRYDLYRLYIGDNYNQEEHWSSSEKANIIEEAYLCLESEEDLACFDKILLEYESQSYIGATRIEFDATGVSGKRYVKLTKELLEKFILDRSYVDDVTEYDYTSGLAILYVKANDNLTQLTETIGVVEGDSESTIREKTRKKYTSISTIYSFDAVVDTSIYDYTTILYAKNGDDIDYGLVDYHYRYNVDGMPKLYIRTSKIFDDNNIYKESLYVDICGDAVTSFRNPRMYKVDIKNDGDPIDTGDDDLYVDSASGINGIKEELIGNSRTIRRESGDWLIFQITIYLRNNERESYEIDFSNVILPKVANQGIYVTNSSSFTDLSNFKLVNYLNADSAKEDAENPIKLARFGYYVDLYFVVVADYDIHFDIYLDPNDPTSKVSFMQILYDITGNPLVIQVGDELREIKVMYLDIIYELIDKEGDYRFYAG